MSLAQNFSREAENERLNDDDYKNLKNLADDVLSQVPRTASYRQQTQMEAADIPLSISDRDLSTMISVYDDAGAGEMLKPANPPLETWKPEQQAAYKSAIGSIARLVEKRIIRPSDVDMQRELREREIANAARTNKSVAALYRGEGANVNYATDGPTCWDDKKLFGSNKSDSAEHTHAYTMTSIPDIRTLRASISLKLMYEHFEEFNSLSDPMAPFLMLTAKHSDAVRQCSAHLEVEKFARWAIEGSLVATLGDILNIAKTRHMLSTHAIVFRHDNTVEVVFSLDLVGRYFAVVSLLNRSAAAKSVERAVRREKALADGSSVNRQLRNLTVHEIRTCCQPQADQAPTETTIGDAAKRMETEKLLGRLAIQSGALCDASAEVQLIDLSTIGRSEYEETRGQIGVPETSKDIRMMARNALLYVYSPRLSLQLMGTEFSVAYHYFVGCQCCFGRKDKTRLKKNHARAVRQDSSLFVTISDTQTLPSFGSDDEKETATPEPIQLDTQPTTYGGIKRVRNQM